MKIPILCSTCAREFQGEEWLAEKDVAVCPDCLDTSKWPDEHI